MFNFSMCKYYHMFVLSLTLYVCVVGTCTCVCYSNALHVIFEFNKSCSFFPLFPSILVSVEAITNIGQMRTVALIIVSHLYLLYYVTFLIIIYNLF